MKLEQTAGLCNIRLRDAGLDDRWTYDDDEQSNWLLLIAGWAILAIASHIVLNIIARYDGRKGEGK